MKNYDLNILKRRMDYYYRSFNIDKISPDPLEFLHRYKQISDIEIAGLISSVFAYGNVKMILDSIEKIHKTVKYRPYNFVMNYSLKENSNVFENIRHRFFTSQDISVLFQTLRHVYEQYGSLKKMFFLYYFPESENVKDAVSFFSRNIQTIIQKYSRLTNGLKFMFPDPHKGSACKRMNLFLRWMVRKDELDFGLWNEIPTSKLIIPLDTHVARISRDLKFTRKKNISWAMAEEITETLKRFDPVDPVKYDFALCHIGMRKLSFNK